MDFGAETILAAKERKDRKNETTDQTFTRGALSSDCFLEFEVSLGIGAWAFAGRARVASFSFAAPGV